MAVVHAVVGAPTPDGATFVAKVDGGGPVRVAVSTSQDMSSPAFTSSEAVDAQGVAKVAISGLAAATQHWWQVEDNGVLDTSVTGRFRTAPAVGVAASYTFAAAGDAGAGDSGFVTDRVSNHSVFDTIRGHDPDFFIHMGDYHYRNIGTGEYTSSPFDETDYRDAFDDMLTFNGAAGTAARQQHLYREVPLIPTWDNHDYGFTTGSAIDSDRTLPHRAAARTTFQERMPHFPLAAGSGDVPIYYSFTWGRVLYVMLDVRSERDPNSDTDDASKTMLGQDQKDWLDNLLATSDAKALCVISAGQWLTVEAESDTWQVYQTEQQELVDMFRDRGWLHRMWMLTASKHALGLDAGSGNTFGGFPVALFASLDTNGTTTQYNLYDQGPTQGGRGQYGLVTVTDLGDSILVELAGYDSSGVWDSITFGFAAAAPSTASAAVLPRLITGSHKAVFEARVLTTFQTGDDPAGDLLVFTGGEVRMDGTADIQRTLTLMVASEVFPRRRGDKLLPDGTEIFVRRGVYAGSETIWAPLGYFRIDDGDQQDAPDGLIRLTGYDRMAAVMESDLLSPRQYPASTTFGALFADLVGDVYPDASVVFDDGLGLEPIGRKIVVDRSRYEPLRTLARARGKIVHFDGQGVLLVRSAPDPAAPVWEVRAGRGGVLTRAQRRVTRRDVINAVVVRSQGLDATASARAVAVDDGPHSLTRFGGRFGQVPDFVTSPAASSVAELGDAARATLLRRAGMPYQMEFTAVPNPALVPFDPVRVTLRDGSREKHVLQRLSVPLSADGAMSAATREQRSSRIVVVSQ